MGDEWPPLPSRLTFIKSPVIEGTETFNHAYARLFHYIAFIKSPVIEGTETVKVEAEVEVQVKTLH